MKVETFADVERELKRMQAELVRQRRRINLKPRIQVGFFTAPNVNGTEKVVTGVGFQPRGLFFFATAVNSGSAIHNGWGFGGDTEDGIQQFSQGIRGTTAGPTMARNRAQTRAVLLPDGSGGSVLAATLDSLDPDGFSMTFITASNAYDVYWMAWG